MQKVRAVESRFLEANDIVSLESDGPLEYLRGIVLLRERAVSYTHLTLPTRRTV